MVAVRLLKVTKRFKDVVAVDKVTIDIRHGEFFTFLGPSGCGKTTTLRLIAGLEYPDQGRIFFNDEDVTELPPYRRNTGMVFQNYALWPHMTVFDNIAYGLKIRGLPKKEIRDRVCRVLELIKLKGLEHRYPTQLSGGQQQRVALARALVIEPDVLLLDEPLSNLDAKLREEMRFEIKELQRKLKITTIYVTHDQAEAMVLADRIAVMNKGRVVQVGDPEEIYTFPSNEFVAQFIGLTTLIEGTVEEVYEGGALVRSKDGLTMKVLARGVRKGERVKVSIRPEHVLMSKGRLEGVNVFEGEVLKVAYLGNIADYRVRLGEWVLRVQSPGRPQFKQGERVYLKLDPESIIAIKIGHQ